MARLGWGRRATRWFAKKQFEKKQGCKVRRHAHKFQTGAPAPSLGQHSVPTQPMDAAALLAAQGGAAADATSAASTASQQKQRGAGVDDDDANQPLLLPSSKLARKKQKRMKNLAAQGGATTDATAITASLKKQRGGGDDDADQPLLLKPKPKRQISSGIRTNDDNTNAKPAVRAMEPASRHACGSFRGFQPRVPLKPAAAASATGANTGSEAPKEEATPEQIDLVRQVQSGAIISILWRWGRSLDNTPGHKDGACLYYSGEDEYFSAKIMQWRKVRGRRLFRLIYDDGCVENDINLLEQTFRILHLQDPDEVKEEGGLFLV